MTSLFVSEPSQNVRRFTWYYSLTGLTFTLPIWVVFYQRVISLEQLAMVYSSGQLIAIALQIPTGALADLVGRKIMVTLGQVLRAIGFLLLPLAGGFGTVFMFNGIISIGESMGSGADSALLYDTLKQEGRESEFGTIYAKILFYYRICLIIGSVIGGLSYTLWYGLPYVMRSISMLFAALSVFLMYEAKSKITQLNLASYFTKTLQGMSELTKTIFIKKLSLFYIAVGGITWSCMYYFNQPFAYDFGWTTTQMSYITALAYVVSSVIVYYLTSQKNLLNRERVYLGFPILMVIALLPGMFVNKWIALVLMTLTQVAGSARYSILDRYVNMEFDSEHRATALSSLNMLVSLIMASLIFFGGKVQGFADTRAVYTILGIISLLVVSPLAIILVSDHRRHKLAK